MPAQLPIPSPCSPTLPIPKSSINKRQRLAVPPLLNIKGLESPTPKAGETRVSLPPRLPPCWFRKRRGNTCNVININTALGRLQHPASSAEKHPDVRAPALPRGKEIGRVGMLGIVASSETSFFQRSGLETSVIVSGVTRNIIYICIF